MGQNDWIAPMDQNPSMDWGEWLLVFASTPKHLPYRADKLLDGEWRVMGWFGQLDEAARACINGFGGTCRVVQVDSRAFQNEWRALA